MAVDELLQHVHPDAVYHRVALPDDRNALGPWREAVKHYVPPGKDDPLWGELIYGSGEKGEPVAFPSGPEGERLRALLDRNQPAMELLEEGVRRGRLQLPVGQGDDAIRLNCDVLFGLHDLSRMLWVKAKATHAKGDINEECRLVIQVLRIGEMICNGDGLVGDYLMAHWNRKSALKWIRKLAGRDGMPRSVLRDLLLAVERSVASPDGLSQCLRGTLLLGLAQDRPTPRRRRIGEPCSTGS